MADTTPEPGRQAALVLLDALTGWDDELGPDDSIRAVELAVQRLAEVGAVTATLDDETDEMTVDVSNLVGGTAVVLQWLVTQLALTAGVDRLDVIARARAFIDGME